MRTPAQRRIEYGEEKEPEELQIVTLENAIYMGMKNDLAFIMDMNSDYHQLMRTRQKIRT